MRLPNSPQRKPARTFTILTVALIAIIGLGLVTMIWGLAQPIAGVPIPNAIGTLAPEIQTSNTAVFTFSEQTRAALSTFDSALSTPLSTQHQALSTSLPPTLAYSACQNEWQPDGAAPDVSERARLALDEAGLTNRMDVISITVGLTRGEGEDCLHPDTLLFDHFWPYLVTVPIFIEIDGATLADDAALGDLTGAVIFALRDAGIPNPDSTLVITFSAGTERRIARFKRGIGEAAVQDGLRGVALWAALAVD